MTVLSMISGEGLTKSVGSAVFASSVGLKLVLSNIPTL